jgi:precorrin-2 dehydrogenase/sirohydrochlorin ferrochelatase
MVQLFPLFLKLESRRCLVVGAGKIADQKLDSLLSSGADLHVVAPQANERVRQLAASGRLTWHARTFQPADLDDVAMVIAATGDPAANAEIFRLSEARQVLCNAVDEPQHCHFYYPAVVRRGDLQIAISTGGHSPALAQRLRAELEKIFTPDYAPWLQWLGTVRSLLFRRSIDPQLRTQTLRRIATRDVYERFTRAHQRRQGGLR